MRERWKGDLRTVGASSSCAKIHFWRVLRSQGVCLYLHGFRDAVGDVRPRRHWFLFPVLVLPIPFPSSTVLPFAFPSIVQAIAGLRSQLDAKDLEIAQLRARVDELKNTNQQLLTMPPADAVSIFSVDRGRLPTALAGNTLINGYGNTAADRVSNGNILQSTAVGQQQVGFTPIPPTPPLASSTSAVCSCVCLGEHHNALFLQLMLPRSSIPRAPSRQTSSPPATVRRFGRSTRVNSQRRRLWARALSEW